MAGIVLEALEEAAMLGAQSGDAGTEIRDVPSVRKASRPDG